MRTEEGRGRSRMWRSQLLVQLLLLGLASFPVSSATCATFAAWLSTDSEVHTVTSPMLAGGFVSFIVSSDLRSIDVNFQLTGSGAGMASYIVSAGVFGPALAGENKPSNMGTLLDLGVLGGAAPASGMTSKTRLRLSADNMNQLLTFMREGRAYVNVMTTGNTQGEVRGQIVTPHCLESELMGSSATSMYHGFANVLISPHHMEHAFAVLVQMSPKVTTEMATVTVAGTTTIPVTVNDEFNPTMPNVGQMYNMWQMDGRTDLFRAVHNGTKMASVSVTLGGTEILSGDLMMAKFCRKLMTAEDSLFTIARAHQNDWITVWSMNLGQPDNRKTLEPKYYAHPLQVKMGETAERISNRFGMSMEELQRANPSVSDFASLSDGS